MEKFSGSPNILGKKNTIKQIKKNTNTNPTKSFQVKYGLKGIFPKWFRSPKGLVLPFSWRKIKWTADNPIIKKGRIKCNLKNRVKVGWPTENLPQIHSTKLGPKYGIADIKLVITVAPQNDICPHGKTYPKKAVAILTNKIVTPTIQVRGWVRYDW